MCIRDRKEAEQKSRQNLQAVRKRLETEHSDNVAKAVDEMRSQLERRHSDEVRRVEEVHRENLEEAKRRADEDRTTALEQMKTDHAQELRTLEGQRRRDLEDANRRHAAEMETVVARQSSELARVEGLHGTHIDELTSDLERQKVALRQQSKDRRTETEELVRKHEEELAMRNKQMEALKKNFAQRRRSERLEESKKSISDCTAEIDELERFATQSNVRLFSLLQLRRR